MSSGPRSLQSSSHPSDSHSQNTFCRHHNLPSNRRQRPMYYQRRRPTSQHRKFSFLLIRLLPHSPLFSDLSREKLQSPTAQICLLVQPLRFACHWPETRGAAGRGEVMSRSWFQMRCLRSLTMWLTSLGESTFLWLLMLGVDWVGNLTLYIPNSLRFVQFWKFNPLRKDVIFTATR